MVHVVSTARRLIRSLRLRWLVLHFDATLLTIVSRVLAVPIIRVIWRWRVRWRRLAPSAVRLRLVIRLRGLCRRVRIVLDWAVAWRGPSGAAEWRQTLLASATCGETAGEDVSGWMVTGGSGTYEQRKNRTKKPMSMSASTSQRAQLLQAELQV